MRKHKDSGSWQNYEPNSECSHSESFQKHSKTESSNRWNTWADTQRHERENYDRKRPQTDKSISASFRTERDMLRWRLARNQDGHVIWHYDPAEETPLTHFRKLDQREQYVIQNTLQDAIYESAISVLYIMKS